MIYVVWIAILCLLLVNLSQLIIIKKQDKLLKTCIITLKDTLDTAEELAKLNDLLIEQIEEDWEIIKELTKPCCKNKKKKCSK